MNENDLSELMKNLSTMINENGIPDNLKELLNNLNNSNSDNTTQNESSSTQIDINTILKIKKLMDSINSKDSPRENLLRSLKPYLKENRQAKLEQYIQLFKISQILEIFKDTNGGDITK